MTAVSAKSLDLWLVLREGITYGAVAYIAHSEADALAFTEAFVPDHDGYHSWAIRQVRTGCHVDVNHADWNRNTTTIPRADYNPAPNNGPHWFGPTRKATPAVTAEKVEHPVCVPLTEETA